MVKAYVYKHETHSGPYPIVYNDKKINALDF